MTNITDIPTDATTAERARRYEMQEVMAALRITKDDMFDALYILWRTSKGLQATLAQDLSGLSPEEQEAIKNNSLKNHAQAMELAEVIIDRTRLLRKVLSQHAGA